MGRPKSTGRLRRLIEAQRLRVAQIMERLAEAEESLAELDQDDPRYGPTGRLVGARRGQVENAEVKFERLQDELATELERRAARAALLAQLPSDKEEP